ncbi:glycosyltransferase [Vibrio breoganii]|uniref:glycosyltransferase n=2 Tax=Vibrio TaxID=662 RepID=UPI000C82C071|nr:glycosyltransferase [Vibrio breoganii]PML12803.1 hypothetical protein BCT84_02655 [Vibrio breoganii]
MNKLLFAISTGEEFNESWRRKVFTPLSSGYNINLIMAKPPYLPDSLNYHMIEVVELLLRRRTFSTYLKIRKILKATSPDLLHTVSFKSSLLMAVAARSLNIPTIVTLQNVREIREIQKMGFLHQALLNALISYGFNGPNVRVVFERERDRSAVASLDLIGLENTQVINSEGLDIGKVVPASITPAGEPLTVVVYDPTSEDLTSASKMLELFEGDVNVVLAIDPSSKKLTASMLKDFKEKYTPELRDTKEFWKGPGRCDLFVDMRESDDYIPYPLLRASAAGMPVLGSSSGRTVDLIQTYRTGYLINPTSSGEIQAVVDSVQDYDVRVEMGLQASQLTKERFDLAPILERYRSVYSQTR